jgi:hypothetical protein
MRRRFGDDGARGEWGRCDRMPAREEGLRREIADAINVINNMHPPLGAVGIIMLMLTAFIIGRPSANSASRPDRLLRARAYASLKQTKEAVRDYEKLIALPGAPAEHAGELADILLRRSNRDAGSGRRVSRNVRFPRRRPRTFAALLRDPPRAVTPNVPPVAG